MILGFFIYKVFAVGYHKVLTIPLQRLLTPKSIGKIYRAFAGVLLNMRHQSFGRHILNHFSVNTPIALQQAKHDAFTRNTTSTLPFAFAAKVGFVEFNLTRELRAFQLSGMEQDLTQPLVDARHYFHNQVQISSQSLSWLLLVKSFYNRNLSTKLRKTFLLPAKRAFHIATRGLIDLERATKNALPAIQIVGRTTKYCVEGSNHAYILRYHSYETP